MLHPLYHAPGSFVTLPEISSSLGIQDSMFHVAAVMEGGMGVCLHLVAQDGNLHLALKSPRPELMGDKNTAARFIDELQVWMAASACSMVAEALAVVSINGLPSVCATWMEGGDYASKINNLPPNLHLTNLLRVVRGLRWVYEHFGVIHRDLKPQNLLLDNAGLAFVADWGLSRPVAEQLKNIRPTSGEGTADRLDRTAAGSFMGTVLYAAPEQIRGEMDIDFRTDVYALGCIMFEMETGSPPFFGPSREVVAYHHLHTQPKKLGGFLQKTKLGLEAIIARCLQKDPAKRYTSYAEFERDLANITGANAANHPNTLVEVRYSRNVIGRGNLEQAVREKRVISNTGYAVADFADILPHLEEAQSLMALTRYVEARATLEKFYFPDLLDSMTEWSRLHVVALNLALCIIRIDTPPTRAIEVLERLTGLTGKPAEYYLNYSLALLHDGNATAALSVCDRGLRHFPDDVGIIGNRTISLRLTGDLHGALKSALNRLELRRDIDALGETVTVLYTIAKAEWVSNLPAAFAKAQTAIDLLNEALEINPESGPLRRAKIEVLHLAGHHVPAVQICRALIEADGVNLSIRHLAFHSLVELLVDAKDPKRALQMIRDNGHLCDTPGSLEKLRYLEHKILSDHFMIGRNSSTGAKLLVREPINFFLNESVIDGRYKYPIYAARVLEWMDRRDDSIRALEQLLAEDPHSWEAANCMAQFLSRWKRHDEAIPWADHLILIAPWKAESYDIASFAYRQAGDAAKANALKIEGDKVFAEEKRLREAFRESL